MLNSPTIEKLRALRLQAMVTAWEAQHQDPSITALAFDERLGLLVEAEWLAGENRRLARALQEAKLRPSHACLEAVDYAARRGLERSQIRQLATCRWVVEHQAVIIVGATGTGKSFLACALAHQACRKGYRALCWRTSRLLHELMLARATGTYPRLLIRLARADVLVLDDWGLMPVGDQERQDLLEILEDRYDVRATIITSQLAPASGTTIWGIPPWPMPSAIASSTMPIASSSKASRCGKSAPSRHRRGSPMPSRPHKTPLRASQRSGLHLNIENLVSGAPRSARPPPMNEAGVNPTEGA